MIFEFDWNIVLDDAMANLGVATDFALAKAMQITHAAVAQYRSQARVPDPDVCCKLAEVNGKEPLFYISAAEAQRARDRRARRRWLRRLARYVSGTSRRTSRANKR